jgi:putative peptidoglycan lipid II flippase
MLALAANIVLSIFFIQTPLQHGGLALATSLAAMLNVGLLTKRLRKKIGRMDGRRILGSLMKIVPVSAIMGAIGWWISLKPVWDAPGKVFYKVKWLGFGMTMSVLFYLVAMWLLKSEELQFLWSMVKRKGRRVDGETR